MKAKIQVENLTFSVPIGYYTHEQHFPVDVIISFIIHTTIPEKHSIEDINDIISYEPFIGIITEIMNKEVPPLLEQLAIKIRDAFNDYIRQAEYKLPIEKIELTVQKNETIVPAPAHLPIAKVTIEWKP